ncbi:hypothetical protein [Raoultella ornithinolytica]|uniref:hypothetical protein n=1 Tax=Raoultella ornithinolytica TaxID=54291 RepID=UPI001265D02A|nr:hypothetical protein [Raoultella ornithinolytica]KAB8131379.1 hypothetical protein FNH10_20005 [Raoultella ornithinolytica]
MLEKIYYLALILIAFFITCGFVLAWCRRSPLALTLTISALVICLAFHSLETSVAVGIEEVSSGSRDFTQCTFIDQQGPEVSGLGYPIVVLMCDDGQHVIDARIYSQQLTHYQVCSTSENEGTFCP